MPEYAKICQYEVKKAAKIPPWTPPRGWRGGGGHGGAGTGIKGLTLYLDAKMRLVGARSETRAMLLKGWSWEAPAPEDFVIATGVQHTVREFIRWSAKELGIALEFTGSGEDEKGIVSSVTGNITHCVKEGDVVVRVDPRYFRPTEVETLLGDATKAKEKLGWEPNITVKDMCAEMVKHDLKESRKKLLIKESHIDIE